MEQDQVSSQPESGPTVSEVRTRSGRVSKPPTRYEPIEQVEDDYSAEDSDSDEPDTDGSDDEEEYSDDEDEDEDEDADEHGNLDGFVVPDKNESDDEDNERSPPPSVPVVKKRRI